MIILFLFLDDKSFFYKKTHDQNKHLVNNNLFAINISNIWVDRNLVNNIIKQINIIHVSKVYVTFN